MNIENYSAYLFTHFTGMEKTLESEQVYMSVSKDGKEWEILNDGKCVLQSKIGECGVRDPFCVRKADGSGFYIIATDLSIYNRICTTENIKDVWPNSKTRHEDNPTPGSHSIIIWESEDLIHWSEARSAEVAVKQAGCTFAPKCIYDKAKNMYMLFWASTSAEDDYAIQRVYKCYTEDFTNFTSPEVWIDRSSEGINAYDIVVVEDKGRFYRAYKSNRIELEVSNSLDGKWAEIESNIHDLATKHEGAALYKRYGGDEWLLMLDCLYHDRFGYEMFSTDDIESGIFKKENAKFADGIMYRHGAVMPITQEEYDRLKCNLQKTNGGSRV